MQNPEVPSPHHLRDGRFVARYMSTVGGVVWPVLKWRFSRNPKARAKAADRFRLEVRPLAAAPDRDALVWLGHASFLLRAGGRTLLFDPVLEGPRFLRRLAPVPIRAAALAPDYVLVSHGHYDHLDLATLRALGGAPEILAPLGLGACLDSAARVQEAGWYQRYATGDGLEVVLLPAQHWHRRGLGDYNKALWGSFLVRWGGKSVYFAGDTGYNGHFKEIREHFGPVDVALLPIGAYDPAWLMRPSHMNPEEAWQAFLDLQAGLLVPMHYGTFDLSDEPRGEPLARLQAAAAAGDGAARLRVPAVGEPVWL